MPKLTQDENKIASPAKNSASPAKIRSPLGAVGNKRVGGSPVCDKIIKTTGQKVITPEKKKKTSMQHKRRLSSLKQMIQKSPSFQKICKVFSPTKNKSKSTSTDMTSNTKTSMTTCDEMTSTDYCPSEITDRSVFGTLVESSDEDDNADELTFKDDYYDAVVSHYGIATGPFSPRKNTSSLYGISQDKFNAATKEVSDSIMKRYGFCTENDDLKKDNQ